MSRKSLVAWVPCFNQAMLTLNCAGGVGGTRHHSNQPASSSNQSPPSTTTIVSLPSSFSSSSSPNTVSRVSTATNSTASSFPTSIAKINTTMLNDTSLASIVWNIGGVTEYRVWYQTQDNMIREVGKNDTGNQWYSSGQSHGPAKPGSPIAASYTGPPDWQIVRAVTHRLLQELIRWILRLIGNRPILYC